MAPCRLKFGVDIGNKFVFPVCTAAISLRPDLVAWSHGTKQVIIIELTALWGKRVQELYER